LLQLFAEYEIYLKGQGILATSFEHSQVLRTVLPPSLNSLTQQNDAMKRRHLDSENFCQSATLDYTDGGRADDKRFAGSTKKKNDFKINMKF
jgi:hypothetical protein